MQKVVTSSNLNPPLKLFFYSPILINNNLLLKIYCENIVVTFLNQDFLFFILFLFSLFSFHPYVGFFFIFFLRYLLHTRSYLYPHPLLFLFLPHSSLKKVPALSFSLFSLQFAVSLSLSLFFFFFYLILEQLSPMQSRWVIFVPKQLAQLESSLIFVPNAVQMGQMASVFCLLSSSSSFFFFFAFIVMI